MSLILEALKKLEREKQAPDRGFLVVAHVPWPAGTAGRSLWLGITGALAMAGLLAFFLLREREGRPAAATAQPVATAPAVSATPTAPLPALPTPLALAPRPIAPLGAPVTPTAAPSPTPSPTGEIELRLNAITQQDGRPVAVLNDRVVREGDAFDGIHVIRIGEAEVEVEINGQRRVVRF